MVKLKTDKQNSLGPVGTQIEFSTQSWQKTSRLTKFVKIRLQQKPQKTKTPWELKLTRLASGLVHFTRLAFPTLASHEGLAPFFNSCDLCNERNKKAEKISGFRKIQQNIPVFLATMWIGSVDASSRLAFSTSSSWDFWHLDAFSINSKKHRFGVVGRFPFRRPSVEIFSFQLGQFGLSWSTWIFLWISSKHLKNMCFACV